MTKCPLIVLGLLMSMLSASALSQETIFDVPSGDILDKGKVYGEFDFSYLWDASAGTYTPRVVAGIGHRIEVGINLNGISSPGPSQTTPTPTIKWKAYDGGENGWAFVLGDDVFIPTQNRAYHAGNYFYAEFTRTLKTQTRLTFGAYDFSANVVATGNKAGGQVGIEQPVTSVSLWPPTGLPDATALDTSLPAQRSNSLPKLLPTWHMKSGIPPLPRAIACS